MTLVRLTGFTLIELMITLAIMALLATAVLPLAEISVQRQKEQELRIALREIRTAIDAYKKASDEGRVVRSGFGSGYPQSLSILVDGVPDAKNPAGNKIYFLRRLPRDPFFTEGHVDAAETWGKRSYASDPLAQQEGDDVFDVYSLSDKTGLNGAPYRKW